jgi:hypothetical protein
MVWTHKGMTNWYRNRRGRVFAITPWRLVEYWKMTSNSIRRNTSSDNRQGGLALSLIRPPGYIQQTDSLERRCCFVSRLLLR